jgi:hypothetical protein
MQDVRRDKEGTVRAGDSIFFMVKEMKIINLELGFLYTTILSAVTRVELVSNRTSYTFMRYRWCYINLLNVYAPSDDSKDSFMRN